MITRSLLNLDLLDRFEFYNLETGRTIAGRGKEGMPAPINFYYFFRQVLRLLWFLLFRRPRIMHQPITYGLSFWKESAFMLLARAFGVRVVGHVHGSMLEVKLRESNQWKQSLIVAALRIPHVLIVLSEYWRDLLLREVSLKQNIVVIPNTIDLLITEAIEHHVLDVVKDPFLVLFFGTLCKRKGILEAFRSVPIVRTAVPEAEFVFAGPADGGLDRDLIKQACDEAQSLGNVRFPGMVVGDNKTNLFAKASVLILPSHNENLPIAIMEGMAMGLPIIATSIAGIPEMIEEGRNGYLIKPGDYKALADRIIRLANNPDLRREMGQANVAKARCQYHPRVFASRIADLYDQLIKGSEFSPT